MQKRIECPYLLEFESFEPGRCALKNILVYCDTCEKCKAKTAEKTLKEFGENVRKANNE